MVRCALLLIFVGQCAPIFINNVEQPIVPSTSQVKFRRIVINNKIYNVSSDDLSRIKALSMRKGFYHLKSDLPFNNKNNKTEIKSTKGKNEEAVQRTLLKKKGLVEGEYHKHTSALSSSTKYIKASYRFVADPAKQHLIKDVDEEELQKLASVKWNNQLPNSISVPSNVNNVSRDWNSTVPESTITVYEQTPQSLWRRLWGELASFGDFFQRNVYSGLSDRIYSWFQWFASLIRGEARSLLQ